jgi:hypothetical protein
MIDRESRKAQACFSLSCFVDLVGRSLGANHTRLWRSSAVNVSKGRVYSLGFFLYLR